MKFNEVKVTDYGFKYRAESGTRTECCFDLFLVRQALSKGCGFEDLADGYGPGAGTHGDWSGIRDSSHEAVDRMLERALNYLFGDEPCLSCAGGWEPPRVGKCGSCGGSGKKRR